MPPASMAPSPYTHQTLPQAQHMAQNGAETTDTDAVTSPPVGSGLADGGALALHSAMGGVVRFAELPAVQGGGPPLRQESMFQRRLQEKKRQSQLRRRQAGGVTPQPQPPPPPAIGAQQGAGAHSVLQRQETRSSGGPPAAGAAVGGDLWRGVSSAHGRDAAEVAAPVQLPPTAFASRPGSAGTESGNAHADPCVANAQVSQTPEVTPVATPNILSIVPCEKGPQSDADTDARQLGDSPADPDTQSSSVLSAGAVPVSPLASARSAPPWVGDQLHKAPRDRPRPGNPGRSRPQGGPPAAPTSPNSCGANPPPRLPGGAGAVGALASDAELAAGKASTGPAPSSRGEAHGDLCAPAATSPIGQRGGALSRAPPGVAPSRQGAPPGHRRRWSDGSLPTTVTRISPEQVRQPRQAAPPPAPLQAPFPRAAGPSRGSSGEEGAGGADAAGVAVCSPVPAADGGGTSNTNTAGEESGPVLVAPPRDRRSASRKRRKLLRSRARARRAGDTTMRIRVCVRKRPLGAAGPEGGEDVVDVAKVAVTVREDKERVDLSKYTEPHRFQFDEVFGAGDRNEQVYSRAARPLIDVFFQGGKVSVFAYGQTGSGKTHTMLGHHGHDGLFALAARDIFARMKETQQLSAAFYEIYCNTVYDLLNDRKVLYVREDAQHRINICGLSEHHVASVDDLLVLMQIAAAQRSSGSTSANELSSRSHAILSLGLQDSADPSCEACYKFIDLAGSERGADTADRDKKTQMEGAEINKSLLALKECIRALDLGHQHIKFRGSKLTEVLRDSFEGNCRTVMVATVSPSSNNCDHTLNTLRYAHRVRGLPLRSVGPSSARHVPPAPRPKLPGRDDCDDAAVAAAGLLAPLRRCRRPLQRQQSRTRAQSTPVQPPAAAFQAAAKQDDSRPRRSEAEEDDPELQTLGLAPETAERVRRILDRRKDIHAQRLQAMKQQVESLTRELRERERAHLQELGMCKIVKRMDEQRVALLEEHNRELQRKIQLLS